MSRITRRTIIPVNQITPLTYRDGVTYIQMLNELSEYIKSILHPSLQHTVDQLVADVETQMDKHHDQYVDGVQEFQRIHDAFMSDVNASLIALNDAAVSDLVKDDTSLLGKLMRELFATHEEFDNFQEQSSINQQAFELNVNNRFTDLETEVQDKVSGALSESKSRYDETREPVSYTVYNIIENDLDTLKAALEVVPYHQMLTLPKNMVFNIPEGETLIIDRPVNMSGGTFNGRGNIILVTADGVTLEDITVDGGGSGQENHSSGTRALYFEGTDERHISFRVRRAHVKNVGYHALHARFCNDFIIEDSITEHFRYSGISVGASHNGIIRNNISRHGMSDMSVGHNSYGIYASNSASSRLDQRCSNIKIHNNHVEDVKHWEGIDTHNGQNIEIINNTVIGCRRGIAMVANMGLPDSGVSNCRVIGNYIDAKGASDEVWNDVIGITMAGKLDGVEKGDAVVTGNTILNTKTPIVFRNDRPDIYRYNKCVVANNATDKPRSEVNGTDHDSGWMGLSRYITYGSGVNGTSDYQPRIRVVSDISGWTTYIRGAFSWDQSNYLIMRINEAHKYIVPDSIVFSGRGRHLIGFARAVSASAGGYANIYMESDRRIYLGNVVGNMSGTFFFDITIRS